MGQEDQAVGQEVGQEVGAIAVVLATRCGLRLKIGVVTETIGVIGVTEVAGVTATATATAIGATAASAAIVVMAANGAATKVATANEANAAATREATANEASAAATREATANEVNAAVMAASAAAGEGKSEGRRPPKAGARKKKRARKVEAAPALTAAARVTRHPVARKSVAVHLLRVATKPVTRDGPRKKRSQPANVNAAAGPVVMVAPKVVGPVGKNGRRLDEVAEPAAAVVAKAKNATASVHVDDVRLHLPFFFPFFFFFFFFPIISN